MLQIHPTSAADLGFQVGGRLDPTLVVRTQYGVPCTPTHIEFAPGTPDAEVIARTAPWQKVTLTGDGQRADTKHWHHGEEGVSVWVERWGPRGCEFHGWIDAESRQLVQAG